MAAKNDSELILSLSNGDVRAFNELFIRYHLRVYRFAMNILHSENDAEEVVQEVFIAVWRRAHCELYPVHDGIRSNPVILTGTSRE